MQVIFLASWQKHGLAFSRHVYRHMDLVLLLISFYNSPFGRTDSQLSACRHSCRLDQHHHLSVATLPTYSEKPHDHEHVPTHRWARLLPQIACQWQPLSKKIYLLSDSRLSMCLGNSDLILCAMDPAVHVNNVWVFCTISGCLARANAKHPIFWEQARRC